MSEPQIPDSVTHPEDLVAKPEDPVAKPENPVAEPEEPVAKPQDPVASPGELPGDPLLGSDSFIAPDKPEPGTPPPENQQQEQSPNVGFEPGVVIAAEPISMLRPGEDSVETTPRSAPRRRNADEMSKRPNWLPEDWKIDLRVRSSGATAGLIDRYFIEPSGQRRFRSKNEVLHFLETGSKKKKRDSTSEADAPPPVSPASKKKKSSKKNKKPEAANSDAAHASNGVNEDAS
ncbi:Methyl-CpG-binding domain protein 5 [Castilleja foliolosa]|uniref:Methyl-CpG-binding domain protein 5 n=1 Tax=Castilleja foliolosa TaxID=1961234 RepID=A0ABD3BRY4_9LAMI